MGAAFGTRKGCMTADKRKEMCSETGRRACLLMKNFFEALRLKNLHDKFIIPCYPQIR